MSKTVSLKAIRSDGNVFEYEDSTWGILSLQGIDFTKISISKEARAFGHGDIITGRRKEARDIEISAKMRNSNNYENERQRVIAFHNSNYTFKLVIEYLGVVRIAKDCVITAVSYPSINVYRNPSLTVMFMSPNADLFANSTDTTSFISRRPMWHDTRVYKGSNGRLAFGEIVKTTDRVINYLGSEPTPIKVIITADGYVNGINITLGANKLTVNETLNKGDVLIVDGVRRVVTKNNQLIPFSKYDANILFRLNLEYGDNTVKVDSGDNMAFTANIEYEGRYGGI